MIRAGLALALALALPAGAETGEGNCSAVWADLTGRLADVVPVRGSVAPQDGDWCVIEGAVIDMPGNYTPDWHADSLRFRGSALPWLLGALPAPDSLEIAVEGLRLVVQTDDAQMNYLFAAQARANPIRAGLALTWDAASRSLEVNRLDIDFPGANRVQLSSRIAGVDLSSAGAMQMSVTSFAVTEADLLVQSHGLFEWYVLMALGPMLLPRDGDMEAAAARLRGKMVAALADLPEATFSPESKAALAGLIGDLPNPSGILTLSMRSEAGFGPARFMGYAMTGVPDRLSDAKPLFDGVTVDVGWTDEDMP